MAECGTNAGYGQHRLIGESACDACLIAHREYAREYNRKKGKRTKEEYNLERQARCGTYTGWQRHYRLGEIPCKSCEDAMREWKTNNYNNNKEKLREIGRKSSEQYRRKQGMKPKEPNKPCGTDAAYQRHKLRGEEPCEPCRLAHRQRTGYHGYTRQQIADFWIGWFCFYCQKPLSNDSSTHMDHMHPVSRGGTHDIDNIVLTCAGCNLVKNDKTAFEFTQMKRDSIGM